MARRAPIPRLRFVSTALKSRTKPSSFAQHFNACRSHTARYVENYDQHYGEKRIAIRRRQCAQYVGSNFRSKSSRIRRHAADAVTRSTSVFAIARNMSPRVYLVESARRSPRKRFVRNARRSELALPREILGRAKLNDCEYRAAEVHEITSTSLRSIAPHNRPTDRGSSYFASFQALSVRPSKIYVS